MRTRLSYLGSDDNDDSWLQFDQYHRAALERLQESGAEFAVIASNSPPHRFAEIVRGVGIPVISILEAVATISARCGVREILILGTRLAMKSPVFRTAFAKHGIEAASPRDETIKTALVELITELQLGKINGAAQRLGKLTKKSLEPKSKAQSAVCLACTELPLAFDAQKTLATFEYDGILYINSTAAHIDAAFDFAVGR